jgi:hypothetical protein
LALEAKRELARVRTCPTAPRTRVDVVRARSVSTIRAALIAIMTTKSRTPAVTRPRKLPSVTAATTTAKSAATALPHAISTVITAIHPAAVIPTLAPRRLVLLILPRIQIMITITEVTVGVMGIIGITTAIPTRITATTASTTAISETCASHSVTAVTTALTSSSIAMEKEEREGEAAAEEEEAKEEAFMVAREIVAMENVGISQALMNHSSGQHLVCEDQVATAALLIAHPLILTATKVAFLD